MGQVLYTATAPDGQELNGYIEVKTNREALDILGARGFSNIQLHSEAMTSGQRDYLEGLSERDQELLARLEASVLRDPSFSNGARSDAGRCAWPDDAPQPSPASRPSRSSSEP